MTVSEGLRFVTVDGLDSDVWDVLAEPSRRSICMQLAEGPRAVGELAKDLPISRPAVSQHLRVLKTAGLVTDEVVGTRRVYHLDHLAVAALRDQLDTFWNRALAGYQDTVTTQSPSRSTTKEEDP
jgi:DNA-binding transcriptional ArsR family regulator